MSILLPTLALTASGVTFPRTVTFFDGRSMSTFSTPVHGRKQRLKQWAQHHRTMPTAADAAQPLPGLHVAAYID